MVGEKMRERAVAKEMGGSVSVSLSVGGSGESSQSDEKS